jgi:hypothetical protein
MPHGQAPDSLPFHHHPMTITITTDEALGLQIKRIISVVAAVAVAFYVAGFTLGTAIHWLSANLTRLPAVALTTFTTTSDHAGPHPFIPAAHSCDRYGPSRPRQSQTQPSRSGVGFA